jgi:hypothetical protein
MNADSWFPTREVRRNYDLKRRWTRKLERHLGHETLNTILPPVCEFASECAPKMTKPPEFHPEV